MMRSWLIHDERVEQKIKADQGRRKIDARSVILYRE